MGMFNKLMTPRSGNTFRVLIATRISGGPNQKIQSNVDQRANCVELAKALTTAKEFDFRTIDCVGKGEAIEREEIGAVARELRTRRYDIFLAEDLGRLARDVVAKFLFGIAADYGTRAISINDAVDTWDVNWEEKSLEACADHVGHNRHISRRIKQKTLNRFRSRSELFQQPIPGYERLRIDGRCDMRRLDEWASVIREGAAMLLQTVDQDPKEGRQ